MPAADASTQAGKWEKNRFMGVELYAKTLGLIGAGNIGSIVADRAQGLKMKVIAFDPFLSPERAVEMGVEKLELEDLLARADFITLHTPLTDKTRNILSAESLAKTRKGVFIINCARGGLVDEAALRAGLESGHIGGAVAQLLDQRLDVHARRQRREHPGHARHLVEVAHERLAGAGARDDKIIPFPSAGGLTPEQLERVKQKMQTIVAASLPQTRSKITFTDKRPVGLWEALQASDYGFWANVNPEVAHPRWSQATEEVLGQGKRVPTLMWNGYGEFVADMYKGLEREKLFM
mgnify:CR=1 FL=1